MWEFSRHNPILMFVSSVVLRDYAYCVRNLTVTELESRCGDIGKFWGNDVLALCPYVSFVVDELMSYDVVIASVGRRRCRCRS